ncbi:MAG: heavy-metal-associated domain-containing protein [Ferruginibacter sp.]
MKTIFLFIATAFSVALNAQVTKVNLKASGLTCSMCSNAINKALKTLDFIESVVADIKTYTFEISFKANSTVDFDKIKSKVEGAGFSISGFTAFINFKKVQLKHDESVTIDNKTLLFVNIHEQVLDGIKEIKILNKGFISPKEYRKNNYPYSSPGTYYVII